MNILITGGSGYIGSHTVIELLKNGHQIYIVDNLSNSNKEVLERLKAITKRRIPFLKLDLTNKESLDHVFQANKFDAVIHFAGFKAVGESVEKPLQYYNNNILSTISLLEVMSKYGVRQLVFSSSATVYGDPKAVPISEDEQIGIGLTNPYGKTKYMIEEILMDLNKTNENWQITSLRYFNPIGAHSSGLIGEDPLDVPNNLMPYVAQVAVGKRPHLNIFGNDYPTTDGTGVRDYIHVSDLAKAHVKAIEKPAKKNKYRPLNIGTGRGISVLELVKEFEKASKKKIPYKIKPRRAGDIAECYADPTRAQKELAWKAKKSIYDACLDTWRWQSNNPEGYKK